MSIDYYFDSVDSLVGENFDELINTISPYRQERVYSYRQYEDRRLCLAAALLLDRALQKYSLRERDMTYIFNEHQKPYFENHGEIFFNLSHSGSFAAAAVSDSEVGCDIQKKGNADLRLAWRFFTKAEQEYVKDSDDFYRLWALKESFIKAVGTGLSLPLNSFDIQGLGSHPFVIYNDKKYIFTEKEIEGYSIAVCRQLNK